MKIDEVMAEEPKVDIYMKEMFHVWDAKVIFDSILNKLQHENDGLIFTVKDSPYYPGSCEHIFKWKPKHLNSIDFNLEPFPTSGKIIEGFENVWLLTTSDKVLFDFITFTEDEQQTYLALYNEFVSLKKSLVLECFFEEQLEHPSLTKLHSLKD